MSITVKNEPIIRIQLTQNGYTVTSPVVEEDEAGIKRLSQCVTHVFPRDVHVIKFIRDLLPQLEEL